MPGAAGKLGRLHARRTWFDIIIDQNAPRCAGKARVHMDFPRLGTAPPKLAAGTSIASSGIAPGSASGTAWSRLQWVHDVDGLRHEPLVTLRWDLQRRGPLTDNRWVNEPSRVQEIAAMEFKNRPSFTRVAGGPRDAARLAVELVRESQLPGVREPSILAIGSTRDGESFIAKAWTTVPDSAPRRWEPPKNYAVDAKPPSELAGWAQLRARWSVADRHPQLKAFVHVDNRSNVVVRWLDRLKPDRSKDDRFDD